MRPIYRARQFWKTLRPAPRSKQLERAKDHLTPELMNLFLKQHPSEQAHSLHIFNKLCEFDEKSPDLLAAALLHDVGKSRIPMAAWERVVVVVGQKLFPALAQRWGQSEPIGMRRAFVVAKRHPEWGAEMAREAGASRLCVRLIRYHQEPLKADPGADPLEYSLLLRLHQADDES